MREEEKLKGRRKMRGGGRKKEVRGRRGREREIDIWIGGGRRFWKWARGRSQKGLGLEV